MKWKSFKKWVRLEKLDQAEMRETFGTSENLEKREKFERWERWEKCKVSQKICWISCLSFFAIFGWQIQAWSASGAEANPLKYLPVQDGGRLKPFDTFARESLEIVYGKEKFEGQPAITILMTWLLEPAAWEKKAIFEVNEALVKEALKLDSRRKYFTPLEILSSDRLSLLMGELDAKRKRKDKLDTYFQALQRLESQIYILRAMASGHLLRVVPPPPSDENTKGMIGVMRDEWKSVVELEGEAQTKFLELSKAFIKTLDSSSSEIDAQAKNSEAQAEIKKAQPKNAGELAFLELSQKVEDFIQFARDQNPQAYADMTKIRWEVHYNQFHPFGWAWKLYLLAALVLWMQWAFSSKKIWMGWPWIFSILGLLFQVYGFAIRIYLAGRPPVSNMYETVVWVAFGAVIFAMIFEAVYRWKFILLTGNAVALVCMILADKAPSVLDPSLQPLEAVLRTNFWLTTHVLTIVISYSGFFLAAMLGLFGLFQAARNNGAGNPEVRAMTLAAYRSIQVGVALLAPGIILGGVWADQSWGRFWGWDPKEIWALVALLGYLALLHARVAKYVEEVGFLAWSVVTSTLVVMAWYGVNYVLGEGKHSYGFGAGGVEIVASVMILVVLYVVFTVTFIKSRSKISKEPI